MRISVLILLLALYSCSSVKTAKLSVAREPAEDMARNCPDIMNEFILNSHYKNDLRVALKEKKLITMSEKIMRVEYPRLAWINKVKKSLNVSLKNWNNKQHPTFYLSHEEEVIPIAKRYPLALEKELNNELDDESAKTLEIVRSWMNAYENYYKELNELMEERISLQYNYSLLKKLKLKNERRDIELHFKKDGIAKKEIFALYPEENTYKSLLGNLQSQMKELDGGLLREGKIKQRIVRQAMLEDMLTIVQRELEHTVKNTDKVPADIVRALDQLNMIRTNTDFAPSTYGVFKITDKVFISELMELSKLKVVYEKIKQPLIKLKNVFRNFFSGNPDATNDIEKLGLFSRVYARISNITPMQAGKATAVVAVAGYGTYRYFWFDQTTTTELPANDPHQVQLDQTQKVLDAQRDSHTEVIEVQIEEELNSK